MWRSENNSQESVLSFHSVVPKAQTRVVRLGSKSLYPQSHAVGPVFMLLSAEVVYCRAWL